MLNHIIQRKIVKKLAFSDGLRFSELQPEGVDNKLFSYHLKITIHEDYVVKQGEIYILTTKGKQLAIQQEKDGIINIELPNPVLFLAIRRKVDGAWLLYKRKTHPLKDLVGFAHCQINQKVPVKKLARDYCKESLGLSCPEFTVKSCGYFRIKTGDQIESFTSFTLLNCDSAFGDLNPTDEYADYFWSNNDELKELNLLPNMPVLLESIESEEVDFIDQDIAP